VSLRVVLRPAAIDDITRHAVYLDAPRAGTGERFARQTLATFGVLASQPGVGVAMKFRRTWLCGVRRRPVRGFANYLVFYIPGEESVEILRLLHGAMDLRREILRSDTP
jgi:toxin ParE1/3/4